MPTNRVGGMQPSSSEPTVVPLQERLGTCDEFVNFSGSAFNETIAYQVLTGDAPLTLVFRTSTSVRMLVYDRDNSATTGSFFKPAVATGGNADFLVVFESSRLRVSPDYMWGDQPSFIDEAFAGDGWLIPYHARQICADPDVLCSSGEVLNIGLVLMPSETVYVQGQPFEVNVSHPITLPAPYSFIWDNSNLTLDFAPAAGLDVESTDFQAVDMTFTTSDPTSGWGGVKFLPGAAGALDGVTIQNAANTSTNSFAGVWVQDATVSGIGGTIENGRGIASGVRVLGSQGHVTVDGALIELMPKHGILATASGTANVYNAQIFDNAAAGILATTSAEVFVGSPIAGTQSEMVNRIEGNLEYGMLAASGAVVHHARPDDPNETAKQSGYNRVVDNRGTNNNAVGGIVATTGGTHDAGATANYGADNWFEDNGRTSSRYTVDGIGPDALARDAGTLALARHNWWGRGTDPDTLGFWGTSQQAYLTVVPMLQGQPAAASLGAPFTGPPPAPVDVGGDALTNAVSLALQGDGDRAAGLLADRVRDRAGTVHAASALTIARLLATGTNRQSQAAGLGLLRQESRGGRADHRAWARRGLIGVYRRAGKTRRAMSEAQAMLDDAPDAVSAFLAHLALAYGRAETGDAAGAWAAWDEAAALIVSREVSDQESVEAARQDLAVLVGLPTTAGASPWPARAAVTEVSMEGTTGLRSPYPNPSSGMVTIPYALAEAGPVRLSVVDVLGREVAVLADSVQEVGEHIVRLDTDRLALGTYALHFTIGGAPYTWVLTVTR